MKEFALGKDNSKKREPPGSQRGIEEKGGEKLQGKRGVEVHRVRREL